MSCECCVEPLSITHPDVEWDTVSLSLTKCGYPDTSTTPPTYYLVEERCTSGSNRIIFTASRQSPEEGNDCEEEEGEPTDDVQCCEGAGFLSDGIRYAKKTQTGSGSENLGSQGTRTWSATFETEIVAESGSCETHTGGTYSSTRTPTAGTVVNCGSIPYISVPPLTTSISKTMGNDTEWTGTEDVAGCPSGKNTNSYSGSGISGITGSTDTFANPLDASSVFAEEYSTADLIADVEGRIESLDGDWNDTVGTSRMLASDESSFAVRMGSYRFKHSPTPSCYLKVLLRMKFTPTGGGSPTYTPLSPYVWEGTGTPCFANPNSSFEHASNIITSSGFTMPLPTTNGTNTLEILGWSFIPEYTPASGEPNGFPPWI